MSHGVRPQIYETTPIGEVIQQLRREVMPVPFIRRMRVINVLSAVTLRKIEDKLLLPFDVMDIHHVLDKQVSQDAIIAILDNDSLAIAIDSGDLQPLWEESANLPLLRRGFEQGWIQRFFLLPFDPICIMLALRAKLLLDAVDELGHSYNLLRAIGCGWIDFGEIEGEDPGDPDSYIPPGIEQPIDYPEGYSPPGPGDPGYVPGPGDPGYIPPADLTPGDPGYTTTPESPGYAEPSGVTTGISSGLESPVAPSTLDLSPGSLLGGAGTSVGAMGGGIVCCVSADDPEVFVSIGYFTDEIDAGETLGLTVEHAQEACGGENYEWIEVNGVGSLSAESGLDVIYTAPESGINCPGNAEIWLVCGGETVDSLIIKINYDYVISFDYDLSAATIARETSEAVYVVANNTPLTWSVSGTGFSLEHTETDGTGNILHAAETACGTAKITITGCDGQSATGYVLCTVGQWLPYGEVAVTRCPGTGNCLAYCSTYVGAGTWISGRFKVSHASLFGSCDGGDDNPSVSGDLGVADIISITGTLGPYYANAALHIDNVAYFSYWGC